MRLKSTEIFKSLQDMLRNRKCLKGHLNIPSKQQYFEAILVWIIVLDTYVRKCLLKSCHTMSHLKLLKKITILDYRLNLITCGLCYKNMMWVMPVLWMFSRSIIKDSRSKNDTQSCQKVMPQFGASLTDNSRVVIYNCNIFIIQASDETR